MVSPLRREVSLLPAIRSLLGMLPVVTSDRVREWGLMSVMLPPGGPTPIRSQLLTLLINDAQTATSRPQPGMRIMWEMVPEINTGGERWVRGPTWKQGTFSHSGWVLFPLFCPFLLGFDVNSRSGISGSLLVYRRVWIFLVENCSSVWFPSLAQERGGALCAAGYPGSREAGVLRAEGCTYPRVLRGV